MDMLTIAAFLRSSSFLLGLMALLAVLETALPFSRKNWRKRHALPNLLLTGLSLSMNLVFNAGGVLVAAWLEARHVGVLSNVVLPPFAMITISIAILDGCTYVAHRLMHAVPCLWKAHRVHHSDPLVDVTTSLRFHPIETTWRFLGFAVPACVLGLPAAGVAVYRFVSATYALFEHMNVKLWQPLDTALSLVSVTPNMHKLHHSRNASETNTNYGNILSWYDRAFRTFTPASRSEGVDYGLDGYDEKAHQELVGLLRMPFEGTHRHEATSVALEGPRI